MKKKITILFFAFIAFLSQGLFAQLDSYTLRPLDLIRIEVFQEGDLQKSVKVSAQGEVLLPLLGLVEVQGLTIVEAANKIAELYEADYLVNPHVNIFIEQYAPRRVSVFGYVGRQGEVVFPPEEDMTLIKAIMSAGGFNTRANRSSVIVKRKLPDGTHKTFDIDVKDILNNKSAKDMPLEEGDIVQVKENLF